MGVFAVESLLDGNSNKMVGIIDENITLTLLSKPLRVNLKLIII